MKFIRNNPIEFALLLILLLATFMRFFHYASWSLSNDELSALSRVQYDSLREVVRTGVMLNDTHPAGVQVFIYLWTSIFGDSEASYRLPFVLCGIISVFFVYKTAAIWFNKMAALFAAATIAFLQFFILYSQLARPYSPGFMIVIIFAYLWSIIILKPEKAKWYYYPLFSLSCALAAYTHYFALLSVVIIAATGLPFMKRTNATRYVFSLFIAALLFLPHLKITFYQFTGGFENVSWIPAPRPNWLFGFLGDAFNNSWLLGIFIMAVFVFSLFKSSFSKKLNRMRIITLSWFVIAYAIGHIFSIVKTPLLQNSLMIFSFPFFIIFIFSFIPENKNKIYFPLLALLVIAGFSSTVIGNRFYSTKYFGDFRSLAAGVLEVDKKFGKENIAHVLNVNVPFYVNYYFRQSGEKVNCEMYRVYGDTGLVKLKKIVHKSDKPYFLLGGIWRYDMPETEAVIQTSYPYIVESISDTAFHVKLFSKTKPEKEVTEVKPDTVFYIDFDNNMGPNTDQSRLDTSVVYEGGHSFRYNPENEWGFDFRRKVARNSNGKKLDLVKTILWIYVYDDNTEISLSTDITDCKDSWRNTKSFFYAQKEKWTRMSMTYFARDVECPGDEIHIYVWNMNKLKFYVDKVEIQLYYKPDGF